MANTSSADPAGDIIIVTASDSVDLKKQARAIRATVAGNIQLTTPAGNTVICAFTAGETRAICATRIWATNTTATGIEAYC